MKFNLWFAAGILAVASTSTLAQSVTIYGVVDTGVEYLTHANVNGNGLARIPSITGELPSRIGFKGMEDLGDGNKALFVLENGFNVDAGSIGQGGRFFGRQAWVGLSGPYGTVSLGRQYTMTYWALENDILGPNIYGIGSLDAYIPNGRADNTVAYKVSTGPFTLGATYSFGRDAFGTGNSPGQGTCVGEVSGDAQQCKSWSAMLKYDASQYGAAISYEQQRGGINATYSFFDGVAPTNFSGSSSSDSRILANAYINVGGVKIDAGWVGRHVQGSAGTTPDDQSNLYSLGASYILSPFWKLDGELFRIVNNQHNTSASLAVVRATYSLSKRTAVYAQSGYLRNSALASYGVSAGGPGATPGVGMNQLGAMVGMQHVF